MFDRLRLCTGCVFEEKSLTDGAPYLACDSSCLGASRCGLGTGGAGRCGMAFEGAPPGGLGAGRIGIRLLPFI